MATPAVMLIYTLFFSYLLVRFSIDHMVDVTLAALVIGGVGFAMLIDANLPGAWREPVYFVLKLYLVMWYIVLYPMFWDSTAAYYNRKASRRERECMYV